MRIELLGHAPDQAAMWAYLKDMGWAKQDEDDVWHTTDGCQVSEIGPVVEMDNSDPPVETKRVDGHHFNLRLYDDLAAAMVKDKAQTKVVDGETVQEDYWKRTNIKTQIEAKMVRTQTLKTAVKDGLPEGYEDSIHKVRVYPAENVTRRKNVWA